MVTFVGVIGGARVVISFEVEGFVCVTDDGSVSGLEGLSRSLSADMLLYVRSPLSSRGRFLVPDASVSSIGLRWGEVGPSDLARGEVRRGLIMPASMTYCRVGALAKSVGLVLRGKRV